MRNIIADNERLPLVKRLRIARRWRDRSKKWADRAEWVSEEDK